MIRRCLPQWTHRGTSRYKPHRQKVGENRASWSDKLDDALWAFRTAYKTPIGCTPYKLVYGKTCHLPIELEHKAYWALKMQGPKRISDKRTKNKARNDKTGHGVEKRGKAKVKSKSKSKSTPKSQQASWEAIEEQAAKIVLHVGKPPIFYDDDDVDDVEILSLKDIILSFPLQKLMKADFDPEDEIVLLRNFYMIISYPPLRKTYSKNSDVVIEFSLPSPIPGEDSDNLMEVV
ncbi:reverse transcriptase domain-containing protein [Tanacetum coccineum]